MELTKALVSLVEDHVRKHPTQWLPIESDLGGGRELRAFGMDSECPFSLFNKCSVYWYIGRGKELYWLACHLL